MWKIVKPAFEILAWKKPVVFRRFLSFELKAEELSLRQLALLPNALKMRQNREILHELDGRLDGQIQTTKSANNNELFSISEIPKDFISSQATTNDKQLEEEVWEVSKSLPSTVNLAFLMKSFNLFLTKSNFAFLPSSYAKWLTQIQSEFPGKYTYTLHIFVN